MSFWSVMNYVVWVLCFILAGFLISDFIKVELERKNKKK